MESVETKDPYQMSKSEVYWMTEGSRTAAFLLVIPGFAAMGAGFGMLINNLVAGATIGVGAGCVAWGFVVALRKRSRY